VSFDLLRVVVGIRVFLRLLRIGSAATMVLLTRLYRMWMLPAKDCARFSAQTRMLSKSISKVVDPFLPVVVGPESGSVIAVGRYS
jgi:hypothetical protein